LRQLLDQVWQEWEVLALQIEAIVEQDAVCQRLQQIPGVGPLIATAMMAAVMNRRWVRFD